MAKAKITSDIEEEIKNKLRAGMKDSEARKYLREISGLSKSRGNELFNRIKSDLSFKYKVAQVTGEYESSSPLGYSYSIDEHIYNWNGKDYNGYVVEEAKVAYTNGESSTVVAVGLGLSPEDFAKFRKAFGWTRNSISLTDEFMSMNTVDDSVEELMLQKKQQIYKSFEKKKIQAIQSDADKWRKFSAGTVDKVISALENWTPPTRNKVNYAASNNGELTMCVGLNDTHISELFEKSKALGGTKWDTEEALKTIDNYSNQVINTIKGRSDKFGKILVFVNGDYLNSCMDGKTRKGTSLVNDMVNEEMFEAGLNALIRFVENLAEVAPVEVFTQKGNHDSVLLTYLAIAAEKYFKDVKTVNFNISKAWATLYRVNNVAIVLSHGGHDTLNRSEFPNASSPEKLKSYIQDLILARRNELYGIKQIVIVTGHRHVFSQMDMGSFEFFCFGAMPASGNYENANNWHSTPRQNCIVLDKDRLRETLHFYFD